MLDGVGESILSKCRHHSYRKKFPFPVSIDNFFRSEWPSVRLVRAEAAIGGYLEMPFVWSSPLAPCQREARDDRHVQKRCFRPDKPDGERLPFRCHLCSCQLWSHWHEASGNLFGTTRNSGTKYPPSHHALSAKTPTD